MTSAAEDGREIKSRLYSLRVLWPSRTAPEVECVTEDFIESQFVRCEIDICGAE